MKKILLIPVLAIATLISFYGCGGAPTPTDSSSTTATEATDEEIAEKGVGPVKHVELTTPLDQTMVSNGKGIYDLKCSACHRLDGTKLVGPGWKDVTSRRKPEWIMNFAINVDEMLNSDPKAMAMLEECLVRMPNQNLTEADARNVLEFMRNNDGVK
ncbi:MAG: cytochrome c [Bacteroidia bacterium]|jgi:mono/diheme cytochrome c family protein